MKADIELLDDIRTRSGRVIGVEAPDGRLRLEWLDGLLAKVRDTGARTSLARCDFEDGGPWAGIDTIFRVILPDLSSRRPDLVEKHNYELLRVLPELHKTIGLLKPTLTDISSPEEKVRQYPADRAFRILHGLIDLLDEWHEGEGRGVWVIACEGFDGIGYTGLRFFHELMRRRGSQMNLTLLAVTRPGLAGSALDRLGLGSDLSVVRVDLPESLDEPTDRERHAALAAILEEQVGNDPLEIEIHGTELIRLWRLGGRRDKVFQWKCAALDTYNRLGLYEDDRSYGKQVYAEREEFASGNPELQWRIFKKLFSCHISLQEGDMALGLAQEQVIDRLEGGERKSQFCYLMAMLHARFLRRKNLAEAERYLDEGIHHLEKAEVAEDKFHFVTVFNRNGLALVRHMQGRPEEAIELCKSGYERLQKHLSHDKHRLHRSVLLYNMAQVYAAIGEHEQAIFHYSAAAEMDPNYSEYLNDRGNVLFRMGRHEEAIEDYLRAATLGPPYSELYTNLGQCYRKMGQMKQAEEAYSRALDLNPSQVLARLGRAQAREALGETPGALADYDAALTVQPDLWDAHASRAILEYERGDLAKSLEGLNRAIELSPETPMLYQNRAVVLADLGRFAEAAWDLSTYLRLDPVAEDRQEVEERLQSIRGMVDPLASALPREDLPAVVL